MVAPGIDVGGMAVELDHVIAAYIEQFAEFDLIHDHSTVGPFYGRSVTATPIVTTNHNRFACVRSVSGFAEKSSPPMSR